VYAPRGWHCRAWSGADGSFLIVTPEPVPENPPTSITGTGVEASVSTGGTGGRFEVAQVSARFFPQEMRAFIQKVRTGDADLPAAHFVVKPYPNDIVTRVGDRMVEFTTPASHQGFGTSDSSFMVSDRPIRGVVTVSADAEWPDLTEFEIRLPEKRAHLAKALIKLEEQCFKSSVGC
jgi:hypothetical protein